MKIVITGASGHLGCVLVRQLYDQGHDIVAISRKAKQALSLQGVAVKKIDADIRNKEAMLHALQDADVVIHSAAMIYLKDKHEPDVKDINVNGTRIVAEAAIHCGVKRFIHISSIHAYNPKPFTQPQNESNPKVSENHCVQYDVSKMQAELVLHEMIAEGLDVVMLNPCGIIGPMDFGMSPFTATAKLMFQDKLPGVINSGFSWVDVRDVARTTINAIAKGKCGENYIIGGNWHSLLEVQNSVASLCGLKGYKMAVPLSFVLLGLPIVKMIRPFLNKELTITRDALLAGKSNRVIDDRKARNDLGHESRPMLDSLECLYVWLKQIGHI